MSPKFRGFWQIFAGIGILAAIPIGIYFGKMPISRYGSGAVATWHDSPVLFSVMVLFFLGTGIWCVKTGLATYRQADDSHQRF